MKNACYLLTNLTTLLQLPTLSVRLQLCHVLEHVFACLEFLRGYSTALSNLSGSGSTRFPPCIALGTTLRSVNFPQLLIPYTDCGFLFFTCLDFPAMLFGYLQRVSVTVLCVNIVIDEQSQKRCIVHTLVTSMIIWIKRLR